MTQRRSVRGRLLPRLVLVWLLTSAAALIVGAALPGLQLDSLADALLVGAALGAVNAVVWPAMVRLVLGFTVLTLGLGAVVLHSALVLVVLDALHGVSVSRGGPAVAVAVLLATTTTALNVALDIDGDEVFQRRAARRARGGRLARSDVPGVVFVQIDGLGHDVLRRAVRDGDVPTLTSWLVDGTHRLTAWETDWSSQTGASQCALLHGANDDVPAFRWYEKDSGRLVVSNHRSGAALIERRHSDGRGLLHADGASRGTLFTGDADSSMMTMSVAGRRRGRLGQGYYGYMANPYNAGRTLLSVVVDLARELAAAAQQRRRDVRPRVPRGGLYPFLRVFTTVISRDVIVAAVLDDMMAGRSVVYADFLGYDEVAHHSGIERHDALAVLRGIDKEIGRLAKAARLAPRPYRFVVLSDHGQSQGPTFRDRYGASLEDVVRTACGYEPGRDGDSEAAARGSESWHAGAALADGAAGGRLSWLLRRRYRQVDDHGAAAACTGPGELSGEAARATVEARAAADGLLVLASGSLGMVYFTEHRERLTVAQIEALHPQLVPALAGHPGIGFVLARTEDGPVVLGGRGHRLLTTGAGEGPDPLAPYGPLARDRVQRTDGFTHTADLVVNAAYDSAIDEVSAFERLVGSHGGMGGAQTRAFVLHPAELTVPAEEMVGAEAVHVVFRQWLGALGHRAFSERAPLPGGPR